MALHSAQSIDLRYVTISRSVPRVSSAEQRLTSTMITEALTVDTRRDASRTTRLLNVRWRTLRNVSESTGEGCSDQVRLRYGRWSEQLVRQKLTSRQAARHNAATRRRRRRQHVGQQRPSVHIVHACTVVRSKQAVDLPRQFATNAAAGNATTSEAGASTINTGPLGFPFNIRQS